MSHVCLESVLLAMGGQWALGHKRCNPNFVHVQTRYVLSFSKLLELSPHDATAKQSFVHRLSTSNVCPDFVQHQKLWFGESFIGPFLDKHWVFASDSCPMAWEWTPNLTGFWQVLDRTCMWRPIGQTFDKAFTDIGQRLDFLSNFCPTNRWRGVPTSQIVALLTHLLMQAVYDNLLL